MFGLFAVVKARAKPMTVEQIWAAEFEQVPRGVVVAKRLEMERVLLAVILVVPRHDEAAGPRQTENRLHSSTEVDDLD